jgi:hypothetical protein
LLLGLWLELSQPEPWEQQVWQPGLLEQQVWQQQVWQQQVWQQVWQRPESSLPARILQVLPLAS